MWVYTDVNTVINSKFDEEADGSYIILKYLPTEYS